MKFKSIITVPADVTVKGAKVTGKGSTKVLRPVGRQTLTGTDYAEIGVEKAVEKTVTGTKKTARAIKAAGSRTKVAYTTHRTNVHSRMDDRKIIRELRKEQRAHAKAMKAQNEAVVVEDDDTEAESA